MPEIKISAVNSFSTEDKHFPASNLLNSKGMAKWVCEKPGEKNAIAELQFEEACMINQIDIGNNGSAFIEVLVKRSSSKEDYQVILPSSSFMSPIDAKNNTNPNQVRIFNSEKLAQSAASQKWDRVKIVCTQPFNKHTQYGIAFIKFFSPSEEKQSPKLQKTLSKFVIKSDDKNDDFTPGSLFAAKKTSTTVTDDSEKVSTTASQLRKASQVAEDVLKIVVEKNDEKAKIKRKLPESSQTVPSTSYNKGAAASKVKTQSPDSSDTSESSSTKVIEDPNSKKRNSTRESKTRQTAQQTKNSDDGSILSNVVFVLSGYQNPKRGQIRDKAAELGAKYRADWGPGCTHLICAFANTPKFSQIRGKGRIVSDTWIHDCHRTKKRLPWRKYRLGRAPSPPNATPPDSDEEPNSRTARRATTHSTKYKDESDESEEEVIRKATSLRRRGGKKKGSEDEWSANGNENTDEESDFADEEESHDDEDKKKATAKPNSNRKRAATQPTKDQSTKQQPPVKRARHELSDEEVVPSTRKKTSPTKQSYTKNKNTDESNGDGWKVIRRKRAPKAEEEDTDEEIKRQMATNSPLNNDDALSTTDVESNNDENVVDSIPELPNLFSKKHFFLFGDFEPDERRFFKRLIIAFDGQYSDYMSSDTNFVVTKEAWSEEFDDALSNNGNLIFVRPDWIKMCDKQGSLVPYQKYQVVAS